MDLPTFEIIHQTLQILWATAIMRGQSNFESPINIVVKVIQMDEKYLN
jgi:hypothetical protein